MNEKLKVSVIIMTLNAENFIKNTLEILLQQTRKPDEIIVADSESDDCTREIASKFEKVKILNIRRKEFDHGGSRDYALKNSSGDIILFFTQDAVITQEDYIERMIKNFDDKEVAMVCGRQIPKPDSSPYERLIREYNYPNIRKVNTKADIKKKNIKTFYMSDVCSAYRRDIYLELGGFEHPILTNEDMLIAAQALFNGYKTVYDPTVRVLHSHNFSCKQEYMRNFDVAAFMKMHESVFEGMKIEGEGIRLVQYVSKELLKHFQVIWFVRFGFICVAKYLGNLRGRKYAGMSYEKLCKHSASKNYWIKYKTENLDYIEGKTV